MAKVPFDASKVKKYVPPITNEQFRASAPIVLVIDGTRFKLPPMEYGTGTVGYRKQGKVDVRIGDEDVKVQIDFKAYVCGSKPQAAPEGWTVIEGGTEAEAEADKDAA